MNDLNDVIEKGIEVAFIMGAIGGITTCIIFELMMFSIKKAWLLFKNILTR